MKKKKSPIPVLIFAVVAAIVLIVAVVLFAISGSGSKATNKMKYYNLDSEEEAAIVLDDQILESKGKIMDGVCYMEYDTVWNYINGNIFWEEQSGQLLLTLADGTRSWTPGDAAGGLLQDSDGVLWFSADWVKENSDVDLTVESDPCRMVIRTSWDNIATGTLTKNAKLRYRARTRSSYLKEMTAGETLVLLEEDGDWQKVSTQDGYIGYVESNLVTADAVSAVTHTSDSRFVFEKQLMDTKINMAWYYVDYDGGNDYLKEMVSEVEYVNVLSPTWFRFQGTDGTISSLADADFVTACHNSGMDVWGMINNMDGFEGDMGTLLGNRSNRSYIISQLMDAADDTGLDGINVDFESLSEEVIPAYLQFLRELAQEAHSRGLVVSVDNYVPTYTRYYERDKQAEVVDYIVIMGYDEHTSSSDEAGSVASLPFVKQGIEDTLEEVPAKQIINAIPFYTRGWVYENGSLSSSTLNMDSATEFVTEHNIVLEWDGAAGQYAGSCDDGASRYSIWLEDESAIEEKMKLIQSYDLAGVAEWRLGYERSSVWEVIGKYLQ